MAAYHWLYDSSPAGWLSQTGISCGTLRSAIEYGLPLLFFIPGTLRGMPNHHLRKFPIPMERLDPPCNEWFVGPWHPHLKRFLDSAVLTIMTNRHAEGPRYSNNSSHLMLQLHIATHTHPFNGPLSRSTQVNQYQKGKINLDFTEVRGSGISWAICKSAPCSREITTPVPHHSVFYRPDALPAAQPTASKH